MEENDKKGFYKQKHGINIAVAAQMRINDLLDRIAILDANYPIDSAEKQKCYLNLVKQYFISAIPYLSKEDVKIYEEKLFSLNIKRKTNVTRGVQQHQYQFDEKLDRKLNSILVKLQMKLRRVFTKFVDDDDSGDPYN